MRSLAVLVAAFGILAGCSEADTMLALDPELSAMAEAKGEGAGISSTPTYDVTIENLTSGGQYFTPPLVAVHRGAQGFFKEGTAAGHELQQIAENGNLDPMLALLGASKHVSGNAVGVSEGIPPLASGGSVTVSLTGGPGFNFFSVAAMLICTNDGFTGVSRAKLPKKVGDEVMLYVGAYDAGTEENTEDFDDLVPECQVFGGVPGGVPGTGMSDPALAEGGVVRHHGGIMGGADLVPGIHGWTDPVARITVMRTG